MRIAILGTGRVARTLADGLVRVGHEVVVGSRDPGNRTELPAPVLASADSVVGADVVIDAVPGADALPLLASIGADALDGTVLWDIADATNPDFSLAIPDDSLGRRIQEAFPGVKVVKAANHVAAVVATDPGTLPAPTTMFLSGDDGTAKEVVSGLLIDLGWPAREPVRPRRHRQRVRTGALPGAVRSDAAAPRDALLQRRDRQGLIGDRVAMAGRPACS